MRRTLALLVLALALAAVPAAAEDVVVLKNGREARGTIVEETPEGVRLDIGAGRMFYPRALIAEVRRGEAAKPAVPEPPPAADDTREETSILYEEGRRAGTRVLRATRAPEGWRFDEEVVLLDETGAPKGEMRTTERSDADFRPLAVQVRANPRDGKPRMVSGEVRDGRLWLTVTEAGEKTRSDAEVPPGGRFAFAARERFLRDSAALGGRYSVSVFDARTLTWRAAVYSEGGRKPLDRDGRSVSVRVVLRQFGTVVEHEWIGDKLRAEMSELSGERLRALAAGIDAVARVRRGDTERATGPDSAPRTVFADPEGGWRIGKPDPSWTFETPGVRSPGALLTVRNAPLFATVDVLRDPNPPAGATLERAAESLRRLCRAVAPDFQVICEGFKGEGDARLWWMEASATTKGEKTKTLARVLVRGERVYRLLAACPAPAFDTVRPDFERILDSFAAE